jgi:hypothetical protein
MARIPHFKAGAEIASKQPFNTHKDSFRGVAGSPSSAGWLEGTEHAKTLKEIKPDYTVMSYGTPIAAHHEGGWFYPDVSHSPTTAKHQAITRRAIGVKSEREKTMERRAAKRAERDKAQSESTEQGLWNS